MATPAIHDLARRLIAREAARDAAGGSFGDAARACDKLRGPLARLAGVAGFRSLLARALALAAADAPWLAPVGVRADGSLEGFDAGSCQQGEEAGAAVVAHLIGLLVTFIGDNLTKQLVRDAWPDESDPTAGGQP